ncbi:MAG: hypothetical protein H0V24_03095 [Chloroflexia bacterium]|nr:hypothetical protein [Chloroflexia bacterium]MDQ3411048.1 hypothetical protein [Chloroflexota bacterium]
MALKRPNRETPATDTEPAESPELELPPIRELTREESRADFDALARERLGMSGPEFIERFMAGEFDRVIDDGDHSDHLYLAMLSGRWANRSEPKPKGLPLSHRRGKPAPTPARLDEDDDYPLPPVRPMTLEEGQAFFDRLARELLGIGGEEFRGRYHAGRYDDILDDPDHRDILYLAMLGAGPRTKERLANGERNGT